MNNQTSLKKWPRARRWVFPVVSLAALLLIWHLVCASGWVNSYVLPSPEKVWDTFLKMLASGELWEDVSISLGRVLRGFGIAFGLAFVLGTLRAVFPAAGDFYEYLIQFFRNVPPLSMIPLLILWCGIGETTKTVIIVLASFFPMYLNIVKGFTGCDRKLLEVGEAFDYSPWRRFVHIVLPHACGDILVGMRIGLGYSWRAIIGAEMVAASTGLGYMILFAKQMSRTDKVIVGIFAIGLIGYLTDFAFGWVIKKVFRGMQSNGWD